MTSSSSRRSRARTSARSSSSTSIASPGGSPRAGSTSPLSPLPVPPSLSAPTGAPEEHLATGEQRGLRHLPDTRVWHAGHMDTSGIATRYSAELPAWVLDELGEVPETLPTVEERMRLPATVPVATTVAC